MGVTFARAGFKLRLFQASAVARPSAIGETVEQLLQHHQAPVPVAAGSILTHPQMGHRSHWCSPVKVSVCLFSMNGLPASSEALSSLKSGTGRFGAATCGAARSCSLFRGVQCSMSWWLMKFTTNDLYKGASTMVFESRYEQASPIIVLTWLTAPSPWPESLVGHSDLAYLPNHLRRRNDGLLTTPSFQALPFSRPHHGYLSLSRSWNLPSASSWRKSPEHSKTTLSVIIKYPPISSACKKMIVCLGGIFFWTSAEWFLVYSWHEEYSLEVQGQSLLGHGRF